MLLIFSQICIDTNLEFDIIKKATKCATMFRLQTINNGPCISFCFCLVMLSFCLILKLEGFHLYFFQLGKTFSFVAKTEGYLKQQSFRKL